MRVLDKVGINSCRFEIPLAPALQKEPALVLEVVNVDNQQARQWSLHYACFHKWCIIIQSMRIVLGFGSNMGDREEHLRRAFALLQQNQVTVLRSASLYLTEPRDFMDQPWFVNTVAEVDTHLDPLKLLECCFAVEHEAGRLRDHSRGPRPIDIDILFYRDMQIRSANLTIPHPRYGERRFVLVPLAELAPDFRDPIRNLTIQELIEICPDRGQVKLHAPPLL
jgi:2-amino-4-hydroxy-6-hydroxymethyldihydropteridine diphosphokinase